MLFWPVAGSTNTGLITTEGSLHTFKLVGIALKPVPPPRLINNKNPAIAGFLLGQLTRVDRYLVFMYSVLVLQLHTNHSAFFDRRKRCNTSRQRKLRYPLHLIKQILSKQTRFPFAIKSGKRNARRELIVRG